MATKKKFKPVELRRAQRIRILDQLLDIGTSDYEGMYHIALHQIKVHHRFSDNPTTIKQLISRFSEDIYFHCLPNNKIGFHANKHLIRSGNVRGRTFCTKNINIALSHNNAIKRPLIGYKSKVVMLVDKNPKDFSRNGIRYEFRTSRPYVVAVIEMSLHRKKNEALRINRRK